LHKVECIKQRKFPDAWPPEREPAPLTTQLDTAWTRLIEQFATHEANDPAATWHDPDQTVGFWIRRMAQETVIHRIDAQLAAGVAVDAIPDDLALDDVDEVLHLFIGYASTRWPGEFAAHLESPDTRPVVVTASAAGGSRSWEVAVNPDGVRVTDRPSAAAPGEEPAARVSGDGDAVARWLWGRAGDDAVTMEGDRTLLDQLRRVLVTGTQ
ncbi:MAG TPA: maleylpyruvate isomerase N-terminal domain-containing protein, partial [Micromonosporaceae bacterium]|nr:maleylpyruvate isomerase N-terminal domain-containing protein [Micromonosporaceae bacterium]